MDICVDLAQIVLQLSQASVLTVTQSKASGPVERVSVRVWWAFCKTSARGAILDIESGLIWMEGRWVKYEDSRKGKWAGHKANLRKSCAFTIHPFINTTEHLPCGRLHFRLWGYSRWHRTKFQLSLTLHAISKTIRKNGRQRITNQLKYKMWSCGYAILGSLVMSLEGDS